MELKIWVYVLDLDYPTIWVKFQPLLSQDLCFGSWLSQVLGVDKPLFWFFYLNFGPVVFVWFISHLLCAIHLLWSFHSDKIAILLLFDILFWNFRRRHFGVFFNLKRNKQSDIIKLNHHKIVVNLMIIWWSTIT